MMLSSSRHYRFRSILTVFVLILALSPCGWAQSLSPESNNDVILKPLVDTQQFDLQPAQAPLFKGDAYQQKDAAMVPVGQSNGMVLTGKVQTLQQAIVSESGQVDWYAWYLAARQYLGSTGGLQCALGTPIKFYRNGLIEAMSFSPVCQASVAGRMFPLPSKTKLDALILPVRPGEGPPASPQEIYSRIKANNYR